VHQFLERGQVPAAQTLIEARIPKGWPARKRLVATMSALDLFKKAVKTARDQGHSILASEAAEDEAAATIADFAGRLSMVARIQGISKEALAEPMQRIVTNLDELKRLLDQGLVEVAAMPLRSPWDQGRMDRIAKDFSHIAAVARSMNREDLFEEEVRGLGATSGRAWTSVETGEHEEG
jgi:hypothetical protein